jgi:hypothetical protein
VKGLVRILALVIGTLWMHGSAMAQCAMCRATAESASDHVDKGIGASLNSGIVYLMVLPYILLATVAIIFFRKKIQAFFTA